MCDPEFGLEHVGRWLITKRKRRKSQQTTVGWKLLVAWKVGSETWVPLKDLKESNPVEVAEFSRARGIDDETVFVWWAPCTPKKRDAIIAKVKARVRKTTHKCVHESPRSVEHAQEIDKRNDNNFWRKATEKEMNNVHLHILEND